MYSAASKLVVAAIVALFSVSCGDGDHDAAIQLSDEAEKEVEAGNFETAVSLLDTLDTRYASEVEVRRSAMKFRAMAVEGLTIRRITVVDDTLARLKGELDSLGVLFEYVTNPGKNLGGNYVAKSIPRDAYVLPRVNDEGYFTLSVTVKGQKIGFESLVFVDGESTASTRKIASARLVNVENSEMTVLQQEDVASAVEWLTDHPTAMTLQLVGSKKTISDRFADNLRQAIVETWRYAMTKQAYRQTLIEREKLERKLQLCRDQLANVIDR